MLKEPVVFTPDDLHTTLEGDLLGPGSRKPAAGVGWRSSASGQRNGDGGHKTPCSQCPGQAVRGSGRVKDGMGRDGWENESEWELELAAQNLVQHFPTHCQLESRGLIQI